jgi:hypothetical protein
MMETSCELKDDQAMRCDAMHTAGLAAAALCDRRREPDGGDKIKKMEVTGGSECV